MQNENNKAKERRTKKKKKLRISLSVQYIYIKHCSYYSRFGQNSWQPTPFADLRLISYLYRGFFLYILSLRFHIAYEPQ